MPVELNIGTVIAAVADRVGDRPAVLHGDQILSYRRFLDRATRLARVLRDHGLGCFAERATLAGHQVGQHLLAQYLHNCPEYLEGLVGGYRARVAPFNVNYRYQHNELRHLLRDACPAVIQYHASFAPTLAPVLDELDSRPLLLQVDDGSGVSLLPGAIDYEQALHSVPSEVDTTPSPDDLYVIFTGGTTGMPKGVLWRQADLAVSTLTLRNKRAQREWESLEELLDGLPTRPRRVMPCPPLMHGSGQWSALQTLCEGGTVVFPEHAQRFDAGQTLAAVARHQVDVLTIVGDAFGKPLVAELERGGHDVSSLRVIASGGAALHPGTKQRLLELVPRLRVLENIGSSESGIQGSQLSAQADRLAATEFSPGEATVVVAEDRTHFLRPGHAGAGWVASTGRIPLGYLGDADKTARTFPVVDGTRVSIPGDRAELLPSGLVRLLGRDSQTINTGGEKVFTEEVEAVLNEHPEVRDALVCGQPSQRWGTEVAALVVATCSAQQLLDFCRGRLAGFKVPKAVYHVERIERTAAGKPDYRWAVARMAAAHQTGS